MKAALASLAIALGVPLISSADANELHVYMPQGAVAPVEKVVAPIMRDKFGTKLVITPALSGQALTKAIAQRNKPEISVFMLDQGPWLQGKQAGLWEKIDGLPNLSQIPEKLKDADGQALSSGIDIR